MNSVLTQIISGAVVSLISFGFGYFLFRSQRTEENKLEVFRRRLNSYEAISSFLEDLDSFNHQSHGLLTPEEYAKEKRNFVKRCYKLHGSNRLYVAPAVETQLMNLEEAVYGLPNSLAHLESIDAHLSSLIENEIGGHLPNWRIEWEQEMKKRKQAQRKTSSMSPKDDF